MAIKLGNTTASLYLGSTLVAAYLGTEQVYSAGPTVPGAPTIQSAEFNGAVTIVFVTPPASDGGSAITGYKVYLENFLVQQDFEEQIDGAIYLEFASNFTGEGSIEVSAVNAVGEGPRSAPAFIPA
jgi:hypothetical protein